MRLGGTETIKVDVRILAASNEDLLTLVQRRALPRGPVSTAST
jgi:transcriptional regulator with GAF, ATPase, and Fis domain